MAVNFRIYLHRNSENLHVKLMGDFDGLAAWELLNLLKKNTRGIYRVIIHTSCLKRIDPLGSDTFKENLLQFKNNTAHILFTGENASQIAPEKHLCL
jgi:hypothetical protein